MHFPWPKPEGDVGPTIRLCARDPVWQSAIRRKLTTSGVLEGRLPRLRVVEQADMWLQRPGHGPTLDILEVSPGDLPRVADWLATQPAAVARHDVVVLLERRGFADDEHRHAARVLLGEAGARLVLASVRDVAVLPELVERFCRYAVFAGGDPLEELPLRCWGPAWQRGA